MILAEIREWVVFLIDAGILYILIMEYNYDAQKDLAKKQRKTKTTKKVTTEPSGASTTEETSEVIEPTEEKK